MPRLLIVVHGMGNNPPRWSDAIRDKLDAVARQYAEFRDAAPFSRQCTIAEVRYDGIFERYVTEWEASAKGFEDFQKQHGVRLPKLVKWLKAGTMPADAQTFFWSTLMDPVLYRGFPLVRDEVRNAVMYQVVGHLIAGMTGGTTTASILSHSLGTAIALDTLQLLAASPQGGNASFTAASGWSFDHIFTLANVGRLGPPDLRDLKDTDPGYLVRPRYAGARKGTYYCNRLHSFRHQWDPFVRWAPFQPDDWGTGFLDPDPLTHIHEANVHGFEHYLDHPAVHIPIINGVLGYSAIGTKEKLDAIARYPLLGSPQCDAEVSRLKQLVAGFPDAGADLEDLAEYGSRFFAEARRAALACKALGGDLGVV
jgi:hypothetical protein